MEKAKSYAFQLLSKKDYFSEELKRKLSQKGFNEEEIEKTIQYLQEKNYLNDEELKKRYIQKYLEKGKSLVYIKNKLFQKGINSNINISFEEELEAALYTLRFKYKKGRNYKEIVKFLSYRGFSYEVILEAYKIFVEEKK
ncbi:MAG: regulatory protein RecX [Aquificae bacterium]|nr:regulatory protein RecX [Aquificota bacterium]